MPSLKNKITFPLIKDVLANIDPPFHAKPQCYDCKHHTHFGTCTVFPKGIPKEIYYGDHDHSKPYPGDNGILFEGVNS